MKNRIVDQLIAFQRETGHPFNEASMEVFDEPGKHMLGDCFIPQSKDHGAFEPIKNLVQGKTLDLWDLICKTNLSISEMDQLNNFVRVVR